MNRKQINKITKRVSNMAKLYVKQPSKIVNIVNNGYSDYPFQIRQSMKSYGDKIFHSIQILRTLK